MDRHKEIPMDVNSRYHGSTSQPQFPIQASKSNLVGLVTFKKDNKSLTVAVDKIKLIENKDLKPEVHKNGAVSFNVIEPDGKLYRLKVKVSDFVEIANYLNEDVTKLPNVEGKLTLTEKDLKIINNFYQMNREELAKLTEPTFISRMPDRRTHLTNFVFSDPLPRSLVYVPTQIGQGLYVLLKTHEGSEELGLGSFNRATLLLHVDSGELKVNRNGKDNNENEIEANRVLFPDKEYFAAGIPFHYTGPYRDRKGADNVWRIRGGDKTYIPREENVKKIAYIVDYIPGGDLKDFLLTEPQLEKRLEIAIELAKGLSVLHKKHGLVHRDLKPANILLTSEGKPLISDFGFTIKIGTETSLNATRDYIPPEAINAIKYGTSRKVAPSDDIWAFGIILLNLIGKADTWFGVYDRLLEAPMLTEFSFDAAKDKAFDKILAGKNTREERQIINIIDQCLEYDPRSRITAAELISPLEQINKAL